MRGLPWAGDKSPQPPPRRTGCRKLSWSGHRQTLLAGLSPGATTTPARPPEHHWRDLARRTGGGRTCRGPGRVPRAGRPAPVQQAGPQSGLRHTQEEEPRGLDSRPFAGAGGPVAPRVTAGFEDAAIPASRRVNQACKLEVVKQRLWNNRDADRRGRKGAGAVWLSPRINDCPQQRNHFPGLGLGQWCSRNVIYRGSRPRLTLEQGAGSPSSALVLEYSKGGFHGT